MVQLALFVFLIVGHVLWCIFQLSFNWNPHYLVALLIHLLRISFLFLERKFHSGQKAIDIIILDAENSFEHIDTIIRVQEWINNLNLHDNLLNYIEEQNGDGDIDSPVSDIAILDKIKSANLLSVDAVEKPETPKQYSPFKISASTLNEGKSDILLT
ncbi:hypothetical protein TNCT_643271 [Trichonephila clavata]|uniref:Uncharacterized protein n=1 Tax=Trichonephila clavata TaxID=2740835 RepID=A0A8X6KDX7_TRICU|nr:hypothetical protein TNCT_643271 [Trichonephila clavata]